MNALICVGYTTLLCAYSLSPGNYVGEFFNVPYMKKIIASIVVGIC
jgi:hypothetical protein